MSKGEKAYHYANILITARNALVHFKPEWHHQQKTHEKMSRNLKGKFQLSPFLDENAPIFPMRCMTHGQEDLEFAEAWEEAHENAVDVVENVMYQQAVGGNTLAGIFYLKAHRPKYRDRLSIDIEQVQSEIDEMMERFRDNPGLLNPVSRMMLKE